MPQDGPSLPLSPLIRTTEVRLKGLPGISLDFGVDGNMNESFKVTSRRTVMGSDSHQRVVTNRLHAFRNVSSPHIRLFQVGRIGN